MNRNGLRLVIATLGSLAWANAAPAQLDAIRKLTGSAEATKTIAYFKVKGALTETPTALPPLFGSEPPMSLKSLLGRLKEARRDSEVVAVVVDFQEAALGIGQLEEIHAALRKFAAVDKDVYMHADSLRSLSYAVATGATHISIVPEGEVWLTGIYGEMPYLRGTLDKIGVIADLERCGA